MAKRSPGRGVRSRRRVVVERGCRACPSLADARLAIVVWCASARSGRVVAGVARRLDAVGASRAVGAGRPTGLADEEEGAPAVKEEDGVVKEAAPSTRG